MKLGTKIILGFIATCFIFLIISAYVFYALNAVDDEVMALEKSVMPTFNSAADAQSTVGLESLYVMEYNFSANEASWNKALESRHNMQELMKKLQASSSDPVIRQNQDAVRLYQELDRNYKSFSEINDTLPRINAALGSGEKIVTEAYESFIKGTEQLRGQQTQNFLRELRDDVSDAELERRMSRVNAVAHLETYAGEYMIHTLRGLLSLIHI